MDTAQPARPEQKRSPIATGLSIIVGLGVFLLLGQVLIWIGDGFSRFQEKQEAQKPQAIIALDHEAQWKAMNAKVADDVGVPLDRRYDPEGYAKLGKVVWGVSNEFRRWAALAAAQSDVCDKVGAVANWKNATRQNLTWRVECANAEVFLIPEDQARSVRAQFDPNATLEDRKKYAALIVVAKPLSAAWKSFSEPDALVTCERLLAKAAVNQGSFDGQVKWSVERDEEAGLATIERDYVASNALGGTLSGSYRCTVAAADGRVVNLTARDAAGLHEVL